MKILFVAKRYYTNKDLVDDRFGRLFHLPMSLARAGHEVCVVAIDYKTFKYEQLNIDGLDLISLPSRSRGLTLPTKELSKLPVAASPDLVIGSGHIHIARTALKHAGTTGAKFILEAYDYYPAFLPALLQSMGKRCFNSICGKADACVSASDRLAKLMAQFNGQVQVIENGFDPDVFRKRDRTESLARLELDENRQYVCFIGSASATLGYDDFVAALKDLRKSNPNIIGLHAGVFNTGPVASEDVIHLGLCSQDRVVDVLSGSSCGVVPYRESLQVAYSNSCKLVEYMATGLPVVATRSGDNERVLGEGGGKLVDSSSPTQLGQAIVSQLEDPIVPHYPERWKWSSLGDSLERFLLDIHNNA